MDVEQNLLGDSSRWIPASVLLGWSYDMKKLQQFLTGRTFAPHWREFELSWLASGHPDTEKQPAFNIIISKCKQSWESGSNDYYLMKPDKSDWHKESGLGHHIRLLTMIVRENMATNSIWSIAQGEQLQRYFENAYVVVTSMREEWTRGGKLYEHFRASNRGQYAQPLLRRDQNPATSSSSSTAVTQRPSTKSQGSRTPSSAPNGQHSSFKNFETVAKILPDRNDMGPPINSTPSRATGENPYIKKESLAEKENNFLESLEAELARKKTEMENKISERATQQAASNDTVARKRSISGVDDASTKRRKSDDQDSPKTVSDPSKENEAPKFQQNTGRPFTSSPIDTRRAQTTYGENTGSRHSHGAVHTPIARYSLTKVPSDSSLRDARAHGNTTAPTTPSFRPEHHSYIRSNTIGLPNVDGEGHFRKPVVKEEPHYNTGNFRGNNFRDKSIEDALLETCAYELKGMTCPVRGGCSKKKICVAYSRGEWCRGDCGKAHVLRTCKYKAKFGHCNKEDGRYNAKCTFGHESIRKEMNDHPSRFHE